MNLRPLFSIIVTFFLTSCSSKPEEHILNEDFEGNELGWAEERTEAHFLEVSDGKYQIRSTEEHNAYRTSGGSIEESYHYGLPKRYKISTSFKFSGKRMEYVHAGLLLHSPTLEYEFSLFDDGLILVTEDSYDREQRDTLIKKKVALDEDIPNFMDILIEGSKFHLSINEKGAGKGSFKTKGRSWRDMRLYASRGSKVEFDFLRILPGSASIFSEELP